MANRVTTQLTVDRPSELEVVERKVGRKDEWCADFGILLPEPAELAKGIEDPWHTTPDERSRHEALRCWRELYWGCPGSACDWGVDGTTISVVTKWMPPRAWVDALSRACPDIRIRVELDLSENEVANEAFVLINGVSGPVSYTPYVSLFDRPLPASSPPELSSQTAFDRVRNFVSLFGSCRRER